MGANGGKKGKAADLEMDGATDPFKMFDEMNGRNRWRPGPGAKAEPKPGSGGAHRRASD